MRQIQGFVALLDVLGFRSLVSSPSSQSDLEKYTATVEEAIAAKGDTSRVKFVLFSDSIIITTTDDSDASLLALLRACSRLLGLLLENGIAVRGSISHGQFSRESSDNGVFVAGRPIVEAYDFERKQDWVGIMLSPSVLKAKPAVAALSLIQNAAIQPSSLLPRLPWFLLVQRYGAIPFHDEGPFDGFAVVPTPAGDETVGLVTYLQKCVLAIDDLKRLAPGPKDQKKYVETGKYFQHVAQLFEVFVNKHGFAATVKYY